MLPFFGPRRSLMEKFWCAIFVAYLSACASVTSEPLSPEQIRGYGVQLYQEGAEANGISSYIYLRIENQTAKNFYARVACEWLDAGTEEEFAREETTLRLGSYTLTRARMRQYFFTEWRIRIRCSIEELREVR